MKSTTIHGATGKSGNDIGAKLLRIFGSVLAYTFNIVMFSLLILGYGVALWQTGRENGVFIPTLKVMGVLLILVVVNHRCLKRFISFQSMVIIESLLLITLICTLVCVLVVWNKG